MACPGIGMAVDCCAWFMSDFAGEVELEESWVGAAGLTPRTFVAGSAAGPEVSGALPETGAVFFSEQPVDSTSAITHGKAGRNIRPRQV